MFDFIIRPFRRRFGHDKAFYAAIGDAEAETPILWPPDAKN